VLWRRAREDPPLCADSAQMRVEIVAAHMWLFWAQRCSGTTTATSSP